MKLKHIALIGSLFPILFSLVLFFGVLISADSDDENSNFSSGITGTKKESYGYSCLTNQKQYYAENYPQMAIEKGNIDEVITMMIRGVE